MSAPNYGLSIAVAKSSGESSAVLNLGTDLAAVTPGSLTVQGAAAVNGNLTVGGPAILLNTVAASQAGFPLSQGEIAAGNPTATGGDLFLIAGGPNNGTNTGNVRIGTANQPNIIVASQNTNGLPTQVSLVQTTAQRLSTYDAALGGSSPCPATSAGAVAVFTPPVLPEGLYAVAIGPGSDAGVNAIAYGSGIMYFNGTFWTTGGFNADIGSGSYGVRPIAPPSASGGNLTFVNGYSAGVGAGAVTINFRCLFVPVPGASTIPPFV
jgi:hypothetical protein